MKRFLAAWDALPIGTSEGMFKRRRYSLIRTERDGGRQAWLWAEELGGTDRISANLYRLAAGPVLKPCEMSEEKVRNFVLNVEPVNEPKRSKII